MKGEPWEEAARRSFCHVCGEAQITVLRPDSSGARTVVECQDRQCRRCRWLMDDGDFKLWLSKPIGMVWDREGPERLGWALVAGPDLEGRR